MDIIPAGFINRSKSSSLEYSKINDNVSVEEVDTAINYLKMAQAQEWVVFLQNSLKVVNINYHQILPWKLYLR